MKLRTALVTGWIACAALFCATGAAPLRAQPNAVDTPCVLPAAPDSIALQRAGAFAYPAGEVRDSAAAAVAVAPETEATHPNTEETGKTPRYNWRGLWLQSLEFNVIENGTRVAVDPEMRDQLAHKPFWHDYFSSLRHFNMYRWNDGDDFLINYVGHTAQGAVAAAIEIQNSAADARLRWGDPGYGISRLKGFLWAIAYSNHSEISPIGEAGIGNEGGFTYGNECLDRCTPANFHPGVSKYTNNTGWVDFIVTPVAGIAWVVVEDAIDKQVGDRIAAHLIDHPTAAKILRGTVTPVRSWSNLLRAKRPWYRDYDHPWPESDTGTHFGKSSEQIAWKKSLPRFEVSPQFNLFSIATNTPACTGCRHAVNGASLEVSSRLFSWVDADGEIGFHPEASPLASDRAGGSMMTGFFGLRSGIQTQNYALRLALRPGFVRFDHAAEASPTTTILYPTFPGTTEGAALGATTVNPTSSLGPIAHFGWNFNLTGDYKLTRALALRVGIGETLVRYRTRFVDPPESGQPPYISYLSKQNFMNRGSWSWQTGLYSRFKFDDHGFRAPAAATGGGCIFNRSN